MAQSGPKAGGKGGKGGNAAASAAAKGRMGHPSEVATAPDDIIHRNVKSTF